MIAAWNRKLNPSGIYVTILRTRGQRSLIYIYRPKKLKRNLTAVRARVLLKRFGYRSLKLKMHFFVYVVVLLQKRIFLMKLACSLVILLKMWKDLSPTVAKGCKCSGCWKVYGDVEKAQALFDSYKECRRRLMTQWNHGASVTSLAVAL